MSDQSKAPDLIWRDQDVPVATRFDDPYFSLTDGAAETSHVFLSGNNLPKRFRDGFHVAELGFGTGLNLCALLHLWRDAGVNGQLRFTSFEAFPLSPAQATKALAAFPKLTGAANTVLQGFAHTPFHLETPELFATVIEGDARKTVPTWSGLADAWFLDGFSPAKNPELWEANLMQAVFDKTSAGGMAATYSAAGHVRQKMKDAGFAVTRVPGFGRKRHMTQAIKP
ncbi:MAG: tRNA (5-methylaminomethyl-2-thiouridine)(34)-methyltransferase MnmD [Pseudomonadota bacterium]